MAEADSDLEWYDDLLGHLCPLPPVVIAVPEQSVHSPLPPVVMAVPQPSAPSSSAPAPALQLINTTSPCGPTSGLNSFLYPTLEPRRTASLLEAVLYPHLRPLRSRSRSPVLQPTLHLELANLQPAIVSRSRRSRSPVLQPTLNVEIASLQPASVTRSPSPVLQHILNMEPANLQPANFGVSESRSRSPVLQPTLHLEFANLQHAILLPVLQPRSLDTDILQPSRSSRSSPTPALQNPVAVAAARLADASDARIRAGWWHSLVPNGIRRSIDAERDIFLRFPRDEPRDLAEYSEHCVSEIRPIARSRYFYLGITDNPAHRWQQHSYSGAGYCAMYVLAVSESSRTTAQLERQMIARFRDPLMCGNIGAGGECSSYGSPHFFYMVFRSDALMRRAPTSGRGRVRMGRVEDDLYGPGRL